MVYRDFEVQGFKKSRGWGIETFGELGEGRNRSFDPRKARPARGEKSVGTNEANERKKTYYIDLASKTVRGS